MEHNIEVEEIVRELEEVTTDSYFDLVVYNDDYNTFDHVIETLVRVCKHTPIQAEQCAHIIHNNGKCCVKKGDFDELVPMKDSILDAGIDAKIH